MLCLIVGGPFQGDFVEVKHPKLVDCIVLKDPINPRMLSSYDFMSVNKQHSVGRLYRMGTFLTDVGDTKYMYFLASELTPTKARVLAPSVYSNTLLNKQESL